MHFNSALNSYIHVNTLHTRTHTRISHAHSYVKRWNFIGVAKNSFRTKAWTTITQSLFYSACIWFVVIVFVCVSMRIFFLLGFFQFKFIECSFVNPKQIISLVAYVQNQMSANFFFFFFSLFNLIGSSLFYSPECGREKKVKQLRDPQGCLTQCFRRCIQMVWFNSHRRESGTITSFCCEWYGSTGDNFTLATSSC